MRLLELAPELDPELIDGVESCYLWFYRIGVNACKLNPLGYLGAVTADLIEFGDSKTEAELFTNDV